MTQICGRHACECRDAVYQPYRVKPFANETVRPGCPYRIESAADFVGHHESGGSELVREAVCQADCATVSS